MRKPCFRLGKFVSLQVLLFNEIEDYRKGLLCFHALMAISGYFVLCALFGTSQLLAAGYLPQMCKTVP